MITGEEIVDEINALRNDLIEPGGIVDELKNIRELLKSINWMLRKTLFSSSENTELGKNQTQEIDDGIEKR